MLGERIRQLRKQRKMTLETLAGKELTKGMLSLIENNKAKPSMESLAYIAEQLEVEVTDLLEGISTKELREILEQVENIYNTPYETNPDKYKMLLELIEPQIDKLSQGYEVARLLELYSYSLAHEKKLGWQEYASRAANLYDQMNITTNRSAIGVFRSMQVFIELNYQEALTIILEERKEIEAKHSFLDPMSKLNLDYHESVLHFAVGDSVSATLVMENALHFSNEKKIFYRIDDLYRLAAAQALISKDQEKAEYYGEKLKQYGEFADHPNSILFYKFVKIYSLIFFKKEYGQALEEIQMLWDQVKSLEFFVPLFNLERGKALFYLGEYTEALKYLGEVYMPSGLHHPFDLSIFYVLEAYKALAHFELGNRNEALELAKKAVEKFKPLLETPFKQFSIEAYEKISVSLNQL